VDLPTAAAASSAEETSHLAIVMLARLSTLLSRAVMRRLSERPDRPKRQISRQPAAARKAPTRDPTPAS